MILYRDAALLVWSTNVLYYVDLMVKEESIKTPIKKIVNETIEYFKSTSKHLDNILEEYSLFLHKKN
jgi:hypothetical protein